MKQVGWENSLDAILAWLDTDIWLLISANQSLRTELCSIWVNSSFIFSRGNSSIPKPSPNKIANNWPKVTTDIMSLSLKYETISMIFA